MLKIKVFNFNPLLVNTYVLYDDTQEAVIIDCGASNEGEQKQVTDLIKKEKLTLKRLINTHIHFDHVLGNRFIYENYGLKPEYHRAEEAKFGLKKLNVLLSPIKFEPIYADRYIEHGDQIAFGNMHLLALLTPGHSLGGLSFYCEQNECVFTGDTLFFHDIGRTDLPGGNHKKLINSIQDHLFILPDNTVVYPGHAFPTTIEEEKLNNPYF